METLTQTPTILSIETPPVNFAGFGKTDSVELVTDQEEEAYFFHDNLIFRALEAEKIATPQLVS